LPTHSSLLISFSKFYTKFYEISIDVIIIHPHTKYIGVGINQFKN